MKVAITGHTGRLGSALFKRFSDYEVHGFSRSNGYDISDYSKIIEDCKDCNVFINNAHYKTYQVDLLYALFELWKKEHKTIINISSISSFFYYQKKNDGYCFKNPLLGDISSVDRSVDSYFIRKFCLDVAVHELAQQKENCKVMNIRPGMIHDQKIPADKLADHIHNLVTSGLNILESTIMK